MTGLSQVLSIASTAMLFNQTAMGVISHNVSNVNTEGYSRQEIRGNAVAMNGEGNGVALAAVDRKVDSLLVSQLVNQTSQSAYATMRQTSMKGMEVIFGTPNSDTGMPKIINDFFAELNNLTAEPNSSAQRQNVVQQATFMTDTLNAMYQQADDIQRQLDSQINDNITVINSALERIYKANEKIAQVEATKVGPQNTNDLRDARQQDINLISGFFKVSVTQDAYGRARILTETGQRLVDTNYVQLERTAAPAPAYQGIGLRSVQTDGSLSTTVFPLLTDRMTAGSIKAAIDVRDTEIPNLKAQIDEFTRVMVDQINAVHSQGVGVPPPSTLPGTVLGIAGADVVTELGLTPGSTFDISVLDKATGTALNTVTVTVPAAPTSAVAFANQINVAMAGAGFPGTVSASFTGGRFSLTDTSGTNGLIVGNDTSDTLAKIKLNPLLEINMTGTGSPAQSVHVRADIKADPGLVAVGKMRADGGLSLNDNRNAIDLSQVASGVFDYNAVGGISPQKDTLVGYFVTITGNLAVGLKDNTNRQGFQQALQDDIEQRASSVSGVNMDEELANLVVFQNAFQASARVITVVDEMFDTLINTIR